ncbi:efflux RND transporter periplasmic adaptor subunit [Phreatobacter stygius]|uniref:Efflux RND transporter periplasmic adaptor subunit n=1 Tax=Phreatobacter stygius TaxID=1940610 RepID=A0A4D7BGC3_9HYPH|nr:efflux RND transporter periplasmic adaptor subunit [Phreatobacter stygius]QCI68818.1 efflux RND transporter periplasmic adaptor subunit [Phreatobacter stygius]
MRLIRYAIGLVVVASAAAAVGWFILKPKPVITVTPSRGDAAEIVYASGVVEPLIWAKVTPVVRERIVEQCNCEGSRVAKGHVLARLDNSQVEASLAEHRARLTLAREEHRRQSVLVERNVGSQQAFDRTRSEVAQLESLIAGQQARLESYVLRAPGAGVVLRRDGEVGEVAELGSVLFWVGEPNPLIVTADVNEEDIPRVEVGQRALLRSDAFPGRTLEAVVDRITPKGDPVTKAYRVRFRLPDDTPLRIGMSTDVNIVIRVAGDAWLVPTVAVDGARIVVIDGDRARLQEIRTGIRGPAGVEVVAGVDETTRIVSPFPAGLADGARVSISATAAR